MSGIAPSFITGANAKIKIGNLTMAFASDVGYQIVAATIPVRVMGMVEVAANEPTSYTVSGSFSVIRYTKDAGSDTVTLTRLVESQTAIDEDGNPIVEQQPQSYSGGKSIPGSAANGNSIHRWNDARAGNIGRHVDPGSVLQSATFDLEIYSKYKNNDSELILKIRDCRITGKTGSLNKRGLMIDNFTFNAILVDNDESISVSESGNKDLGTRASKLKDFL
jgi:hypothetical protein